MEKSADAFRTISEVADDLSMPQHVLRFWETRFPQIRPLKRAGGRRYYRPADVVLLRTIRQLLYDDGYTIKGVQRLLKEHGAKGLAAGAPLPGPGRVNGGFDTDDDLPESSEDRHGEAQDGPRGTPDAVVSHVASHGPQSADFDRAALEEALAVIDDCRRILDALRPSRG